MKKIAAFCLLRLLFFSPKSVLFESCFIAIKKQNRKEERPETVSAKIHVSISALCCMLSLTTVSCNEVNNTWTQRHGVTNCTSSKWTNGKWYFVLSSHTFLLLLVVLISSSSSSSWVIFFAALLFGCCHWSWLAVSVSLCVLLVYLCVRHSLVDRKLLNLRLAVVYVQCQQYSITDYKACVAKKK